MSEVPLVVHIIFRLDFGGLENGLVNLINHMPADKYRHAIICVSDFTDFKKRIRKSDVEVFALHKKPGNDFGAYIRLWKLLRKLKPEIVHTRNIGTIEYVVPAMLAGVKYRIHGEHGRDMTDIDGTNKKYILLRRFYSVFLNQFIALSKDLEQWLLERVEIDSNKIVQLYNGVDLARFEIEPQLGDREKQPVNIESAPVILGTIGRLQAEKDQSTLIKAYALVLQRPIAKSIESKLVIIGDGSDRDSLEALVVKEGLSEFIEFLGARNDIPEQLSKLDIFVLPSRGEGISNTILEAMASSLPVIATNVGGNPELVEKNVTGILVASNNPEHLADAIVTYLDDLEMANRHGKSGRVRVESLFSLDKMIGNYTDVYDHLLGRKPSLNN